MDSLRSLDLNLLLTLQILLEERSVTKAAGRLGLTQPAISHKLKRLREALDDPLFTASPAGLIPTQRAESMAVPIREALAQLAKAVADVERFEPTTAKHNFVLAAADIFEYVALPRLLTFFRSNAPGITLTTAPRRKDTLQRLERGEVHLTFGPFPETRAGLRQVRILQEPFVVVARQKHPAFRKRLSRESYMQAQHVLIAPHGKPGGVVDDILAEAGRSRRVAVRIAHFAPAPFLVAQSDLLLTAPASLARQAAEHAPLQLRPVPLKLPKTQTFMTWHERYDREPSHTWFRETMRSIGRQLA